MGRYAADQNKVVGLFESGAYAAVTATPFWIGRVQTNTIDDSEGLSESRYMGTASRNVSDFDRGPIDVTGTLTYNPVDMRMLFWALGSTVETSGTTSVHAVSEIDSDVCQNPFVSGTGQDMTVPMCYSLEDSKQSAGTGRNFVRTLNGVCTDNFKLSAKEGEKVVCEVDYVAQSLTPSSGTTTSVVDSGLKPYMWDNTQLTLAGSTMDTNKEFSLELAKNLQVNHYIGSSALGRFHGRYIAPPVEGNRNYTLSVTMDLPSDDAMWLYEQKYKAGSSFNSVLDMNADGYGQTGSRHTNVIMSGCTIVSMDNPSEVEGLNETTIEIRPTTITGSAWDTISNYNPW